MKPVSEWADKKYQNIAGKILRPPGAVFEYEFLMTCTKCYECVKACDYEAVSVYHNRDDNNDLNNNTPCINPTITPCYMCEDTPCIHACKSGALRELDDIKNMKIGVAVIKDNCLIFDKVNCNECLNSCPMGEDVIYFLSGKIVINTKKCTGCGICSYHCPQNPKAVIVEKIL